MDEQSWNEPLAEEEAGPVLPRRRMEQSVDMDITPMIDITFLLLIFFLVASIPDPTKAVNLPPARHGAAVNPKTSVIITVAEPGEPGPALVYLGDGKSGRALPDDPTTQNALIAQFVRESYRSTVIIKAEKGVKHREVSRVAAAAAEAERIELHLAVLEVR